jgi:hypothetical protein
MLIACWGINGLVHVNWVPRDARINAVYFRDEKLISISKKPQTIASGGHRRWTLAHMDNTKFYTVKVVSSIMPDLRFERTPSSRPDLYPSEFFLFGC